MYQPFTVKDLQLSADEKFVNGPLTLVSRDLLSFPAFEMKGYALHVVSKNKLGKSLTEKRIDIATLQPGETSPLINFQLPVDANAQLVTLQITDALGYNRYDSVLYLQKPTEPKIVGIYTDLDAIRVVFNNDGSANHYFIKYGTNQLSNSTSKVALGNFIQIDNLSRDSVYQLELFAQNNVGTTSTVVKNIQLQSTELPPIVYAVETTTNSMHISLEGDPLDFKYEIEYGTKSGVYQKRLMFHNKGVIQIPNLKSNQTYFFRMRRFMQWGFSSDWTNELMATTK